MMMTHQLQALLLPNLPTGMELHKESEKINSLYSVSGGQKHLTNPAMPMFKINSVNSLGAVETCREDKKKFNVQNDQRKSVQFRIKKYTFS
jgi:hypothetical protein